MKVNNLRIRNIASFRDFSSDAEFAKTTLFFGTNGSGKSTIASLLQLIDRYFSNGQSVEQLEEIREYVSGKTSKEAANDENSIVIDFSDNSLKVSYDRFTDSVKFTGNEWHPIKVFNDRYTERTIGKVIDINLEDSGLIIGEPNRLLESEQKKLYGLINRIENYEKKFISIIDEARVEYNIKANSQANVAEIISMEKLKQSSCEFAKNAAAIDERKKLGYETPEDNLSIITHRDLSKIIEPEVFISLFNEIIEKPELVREKAKLLLNFTNFYKDGVEAFNSYEEGTCPFCFQDWQDSEKAIIRYETFLKSTFNQQRELITSLSDKFTELTQEIRTINGRIDSIQSIVIEDGKKYDVNTDNFIKINEENDLITKLKAKIKSKLSNMAESIDISGDISQLITNYAAKIEQRNTIIKEIKDSIKSIRSKRIAANKEVAKYLMRRIWDDNKQLREDITNTDAGILQSREKIEDLEKQEVRQDTICTVFNGLIDFIGLSEYRIANDKKLLLKLNKDYDISEEGGRISSSQKKLLSMCYFIAEIISEIETPSDLKKYILIFDDPVDSADFIYFHSITALLENIELVLKKILNTKILKFGQIIVMTHNSLLHDRLSKSFQFKRSITKIENISLISPSEKTMNNYKIYLQYIIRYYKNPKKNRKDMIFIGTLIRRVLEILSNFNNLDNNKFNQYILDIGKPKLALLANHLSHESFTKVLNPFNTEIELRDACEELLDVIRQSHPIQFEHIQNGMLTDIEV